MYAPLFVEVPRETTPEGTSLAATSCGALTSQSTTTSATSHSGNTSFSPNKDFEPVQKEQLDAPPSEESKKPPFGCGCGKCTFLSFIAWGCPTPVPSASSFPYLDLSELTPKQQEELRGRLQFESQQIMMQFQKLVSSTIESLIRQNVSLQRLVSHIMTLGAFDPVYKKPQVPLFQYCLEKLNTVENVPEIFLVLQDYFSFFNYDIIEHIIEMLGTEEDKARLQRYKDDFNQYAKRTIFECQSEFGSVSDTDHADIFVKLDSHYEKFTVAEIEVFRHKLCEILRVSSKGVLRLCRVEKGCFQLMFQVH